MPKLSVIITTHNEKELASTVESVRANTSDCEIIVVDDGGTDDLSEIACDKLIRHETKVGIARSRLDGVKEASGLAYGFLDAHQWLSDGCLNKCLDVALERQAIVAPCTRGPKDRLIERGRRKGQFWTGHCSCLIHSGNGLFKAEWNNDAPKDKLSRCTMMICPGYVIPASIFDKVRWIDGMQFWGANEPCICIKAFFADVDLLHLCGPMARHRFKGKKEDKHLRPSGDIWKNHARIARVCFEDKTWRDYWEPKIFRKRGMIEQNTGEWDDPVLIEQHKQFQSIKQRPDEELWRGVMHRDPYPTFS